MSKAFRAAFHRLVQRLRPRPVGSRLMIARYRHFRAACSVGKWPRAFTARRSRALTDSIAFVVEMTVLISRSKARNGTNSAQAFSQSRMTAGYCFSHLPGELGEPVQGIGLGCGGVDGLEVPGHLGPVPFRGVL